jgi:hypothetical protein
VNVAASRLTPCPHCSIGVPAVALQAHLALHDIQPGDRCDQLSTTGQVVRLVYVVTVGDADALVQALHGPTRGTRYWVPTNRLLRIDRSPHP